ncbi:MAG: hypothetical protein EOO62_30665, partial [Hymenobacter sp.]
MVKTSTPNPSLLVPLEHLQPAVTAQQQASIDRAVAQIAATADLHPGVTIVHNILTDSVEYMSRRGLALLQTSLAALHALGPGYNRQFFNPVDAADYMPRLYQLLHSPDPLYVVSYFQQVRPTESAEYSLYLSTSRVLLRAADESPLLI